MPSKTKFGKEKILNTAFEIVEHEGITTLTARAIAEKLGCSVTSIYSNYENLEKLNQDLLKKITNLFLSSVDPTETEDPFFSMGIRNIRFAIRYPNLYSYFVKHNQKKFNLTKQDPATIKIIQQNEEFKGFTEEEIGRIFLQLYIFTQGICFLIIENKFTGSNSETQFIDLLYQTGEAIIKNSVSSFKKNF